MRTQVTAPRLGHVALNASVPQLLADFYRDLLDLQVVRHTSNSLAGDAVLLSGDPAREDHELVLLTSPAAQHTAFRVDSMEQLRARYRRAKRLGLQIPYALDAGTAVSFFVRDPEGNAVEIYLATTRSHRCTPPLSDPDQIARLILGCAPS